MSSASTSTNDKMMKNYAKLLSLALGEKGVSVTFEQLLDAMNDVGPAMFAAVAPAPVPAPVLAPVPYRPVIPMRAPVSGVDARRLLPAGGSGGSGSKASLNGLVMKLYGKTAFGAKAAEWTAMLPEKYQSMDHMKRANTIAKVLGAEFLGPLLRPFPEGEAAEATALAIAEELSEVDPDE